MSFKDRISELQGILVVDYESGQRLGKMVDLFWNKDAQQIAGIAMKKRPLATEAPWFVAMENIHKIGRDVVIIAGADVLTSMPEGISENSLKDLKHRSVTTRQGQHLGDVTDFTVTPEGGRIEAIILSDEKRMPIEAGDVFFGPDAVIVPIHYADRLSLMEGPASGVLSRMTDFAAIGESVKVTGRSVGHQIRATAGKMSEAISDSLKRRHHRSTDKKGMTAEKAEKIQEEISGETVYSAADQRYPPYGEDGEKETVVEEEK